MNLLKNQYPIWFVSSELIQKDRIVSSNPRLLKKLYLFRRVLAKYKNTFIHRFLLFNLYLNRYLTKINFFQRHMRRKHIFLFRRILKKRYVKKYWLHFVRLFVLKRKKIKRKERLIESLLLNPRQRRFRFLISKMVRRANKKAINRRLRMRRRRITFVGMRKRRYWYPRSQYRKLKRLKRKRRHVKWSRAGRKQKTIRRGKKFRLVSRRRRLIKKKRIKRLNEKKRIKRLRLLRLKKKIKQRFSLKRRSRLQKINPVYLKLRKPKFKRIRFLRRPKFSFIWKYFNIFRRLNRFYRIKRRISRSKKFVVNNFNRVRVINKKLAFVFYRGNDKVLNRVSIIAKSKLESLAFLRRKFLLTRLKPIIKNSKARFSRKKKPRVKGRFFVRRLYRSMFSLFFKKQSNKSLFRPIIYYLSYKFLRDEAYNLKRSFGKQRWFGFVSTLKYRKLFRVIMKFKAFYLFKKLKLNYFFSPNRKIKFSFKEVFVKRRVIYPIFFNTVLFSKINVLKSNSFSSFINRLRYQRKFFKSLNLIHSVRSLRKFYGKFWYYGLAKRWRRKLKRKHLKRVSNIKFLRRRFRLRYRRHPKLKYRSRKKKLFRNITIRKWWPKNWNSLSRRRQKAIRRRRSLYKIARFQFIRKSLRVNWLKPDRYNGRFQYWELRKLRKQWRSFLTLRRKRLKIFKRFLSKLPFIKALKTSRIFCLGLKFYIKQRKRYFIYQSLRRLVHQRDKAYFSKQGYVKFCKTRHNLFISIYDRWDNLLFHTSAWAFASRRDPDRFSYKSLIFAARKLAARLWKLRFKRINVRLSSPVNFQIRIFLKTLKIKRIKVLTMLNFIKIPHNGLRPQKSRTQT